MTRGGRKGGMTAAEVREALRSNPEWVAMNRKADEQEAALLLAEKPIVEALRRAGVEVQSVWDLVNSDGPYSAAIPVLLEHLVRPYPVRIREGIARALAVPEANVGWHVLAREFEGEVDATTCGMKYALAVALGGASTDVELERVLRWVTDPSLGRNRVPLLRALARSRDPRSLEVLGQLANDPTLKVDAEKALRHRMRRRR
jgi:hypothetical protein